MRAAQSARFAKGHGPPAFALVILFGIIVHPDAVGGHDSSEPKPHRWCPEKEIPASAIQRGRRKTPHWLCLGVLKQAAILLSWANPHARRRCGRRKGCLQLPSCRLDWRPLIRQQGPFCQRLRSL